MKQPDIISATQEQLDELLALAKAASFPQPQYDLLASVLGTFIYVMQSLQNAKLSLKRFRHMLFGARTENKANVLQAMGEAAESRQGPSSDAGDMAVADAQESAGAALDNKVIKGHGRNGAAAYPGAPVVDIRLTDLESGDICPECLNGKVYSSPPKTIVKVLGQAPLAATIYRLARLRCRLCDAIFTASMPQGVSASKYDPSCASMLALLRYGSGMPLHRVEKLQACLHMPLPDATQWEIVEAAAEGAGHAYEEMIRQAAQGEVLHNDDTPARILALMGERRRKAEAQGEDMPTSKAINTSGIVARLGQHKVVLFFTGPTHAGTNLAQVLAHRAKKLRPPIQMCNALAANVKGDFDSILGLCLAHSRRKFVEVASNFPTSCRHVIDVFASIYQHDDHARQAAMTDLQRLQYHRAHSRPLMLDLKQWMETQLHEKQVEANGGLGQAMRYMLKHWKGLTLFLRKAGAPVDNNIAERALKKAIIHRKNSLFYRSQHGADVGDIFMSLIYTCESCGSNPFAYLQALQVHATDVEDHPQQWLPWNYHVALAGMT